MKKSSGYSEIETSHLFIKSFTVWELNTNAKFSLPSPTLKTLGVSKAIINLLMKRIIKMKNINWDKCESRGTIGSYGENTKIEHIDNVNIIPNMRISARYKNCDINLQIIKETPDNKYNALVKNIGTSKDGKPDDLFINDEVSIDRKFICTIHFP